VELTVRAWAQVMNPQQTGPALVPTGNAGERDGLLDPDGAGPAPAKSGRHHTYQVNFELPTAPSVTNVSLKPGIDGQAYPGDRIVGTGGVPLLAPYPVGFFDGAPGAMYPSATAQRAYEWSSTYAQDASYDPPLGPGSNPAAAGLPYNLTLVTSSALATNGNITGSTFDRGFHPCRFVGTDFYVGNVATVPPHATAYQTQFEKTLALSVSPDKAIYLRGVQASEAAGGSPTGLIDSSNQMAEPRMVPLLQSVGLFSVDTGKSPVRNANLPITMDILPVIMPHGGTDTHNQMSQPQLRGYWPAESNKEVQWFYYPSLGTDQGWKHLQQEFTWLQCPDAQQRRVYMWAEGTTVVAFQASTWNQRWQELDPTKRRGVIVLHPGTGAIHVPAVLSPTADSDHGVLFGAEVVVGGRQTTATTAGTYYVESGFYSKVYYYNVRDTQHDRMAHMHGGGNYLQTYNTTYQSTGGYYMSSLGRTATSVAMSSDGKWCATALVGGSNQQKILLWRTDNTPIPAAILAQPFAEGVPWVDETWAARAATDSPRAVILKVGGVSLGSVTIANHPRYLLPDSLMFVENGLLFLNETQLDHIFGVSLVTGQLSFININSARQQVNGAGFGPSVHATHGQFIPDADILVAAHPTGTVGTQYGFAGNKPVAGEEGPNKVAFVAGAAGVTGAYGYLMGGFRGALTDLPAAYPRQGYASAANADMSLYFMSLATAGGLNLSASTLRDLTGNDPDVYGDLLTPGRFGEELDRLVLSDDGNYVAVVREQVTGGTGSGVGYGVGGYIPSLQYGYYGAFGGYYPYILTSTTNQYQDWFPTQDLLVVSTSGADMHSGTAGAQHVLFLGTGTQTTSAKGGMPGYAVQYAHFNAEGRRIHGLQFAPDGQRLIINYAGGTYYNPASSYGTVTNWQPFNPSYTSYGVGDEISVSLAFRTSTGTATDFSSTSNLKNNLQGINAGASVGQTSFPIGETTSQQCFWATFRSEDGNFLYYVSDQIDASLSFTTANRNHMVGFNISAAPIGDGTAFSPVRNPWTPFSTHPATIGFEQFDCNAWSYENRFAASPGGVFFNGRDAKGILCVIGSDASAGAGSPTDLEVYVMDTNRGTNLAVLTSPVTTGTANAINHLWLSADGNMLAGQIAKTTASSASSRAMLNSNSDIFVVTNIHAVLDGAAPQAIVVSAGQSHGATVAFVGDGTLAGPQALIYSAGTASSSNTSWSTRSLKAVPLVSGAVPASLDNTQSTYSVLTGGRKLDDVATTAD
jgi:hypothetical protein